MTRSRYPIQVALIAGLLVTGPAAIASESTAAECSVAADQAPADDETCATAAPTAAPTTAPTAAPTPAQSPTPGTDSTPAPEETPPPEGSNETPAPEPSPAEPDDEGTQESRGGDDRSRSGSAGGPPGQSPSADDLLVTVTVDRTIAQVGTPLEYQITVQNPGTEAASATIVDTMPNEVEFVAAEGPIMPTVGSGSLTWDVLDIQPGASVVIGWQGRVARTGDLDAVNIASIAGTPAVPVVTHTYLAAVKGVALNRSPEEPDWGTHKERRVVFRTRTVYPSADTAASASAAPGAIPYTGAAVVPFLVAAALFVLGGWVLFSQRGRRVAAVSMLVVLVAAACTSDTQSRDQGPAADQAEDEDEVLGTRVSRGNNGSTSDPAGGNNNGAATGGNTGGNTGADGGNNTAVPSADEDDDPPLALPGADDPPGDAAPAPEPEQVTTRDVVVVEVPNEPPAPRALPSSPADNAISLEWDAASRSIVSASSRAIFRADSPIQFLASLADGDGAVSTRLTLTNVTDDERLQIGGRMVLTVSGDGGTIRLTSPPLDQVLEPGDEVSAEWDFALPSGDYFIESSYLAG